MRLTSLDIQGFKSFATKTHLSFTSGVTGVIGPNGSGKSNVAEAIRFVLGEQSMKALRSKDRADVLYSGHAKHAPFARVTLNFDNESGRFPIQTGEISIARTLHKNGDSEYSINSEPVRLIDLQQMLAEAGIGAKSYTVISQGMIDQYLTASPEGRRELFNEATGIKSLQIKVAQSQQKLNKSREHAHEVETILEELSPRLKFLQRQMSRYDERDDYVVSFTAMQKEFYHSTWHEMNTEKIKISNEYTIIQKQIVEARSSRMQAETEALAEAAHKNPKEALLYELSSERAHYALSFETEKAELTTSLEEIAKKIKELEKKVSTTTSTSAQSIRKTLLACKDFVDQIVHGMTPERAVAIRLLKTISDTLTHPESADNSPRIVLAQLVAVEEEQRRHLHRLPIIEKPSDKKITELKSQIEKIKTQVSNPHANTNADQAREKELTAERTGASLTAHMEEKTRSLAELEREITRECGAEALQQMQTTTPAGHRPSEAALRTLATKISTIGERDELVAKEYEETKQRHDALETQLQDVTETMGKIQTGIDEITKTMQHQFDQQFSQIQIQFSEYFTHLFGGGSAELTSDAEGIHITVIPPQKKARQITLLSGGERALTSIALLFAILDAQKPPFIVLDEVDAALDEANSHRFARLLKKHASITQSIVISHNRETMSQSDLLYGVTMHKNGISSIYSVKIVDYVEDNA
jgi:chromosome segregation protein